MEQLLILSFFFLVWKTLVEEKNNVLKALKDTSQNILIFKS